MQRYTVLVTALAMLITTECFAQYGSTPADSIARSLEDIRSQMLEDSRNREMNQTIESQLVYYRQLSAVLDQRLNAVANSANIAVKGWQQTQLQN